MTRSTAALVCAATATRQPRRGPHTERCPRKKWMAATSSMLLPVPKGPCTTHSGLAACAAAGQAQYYSHCLAHLDKGSIKAVCIVSHKMPRMQTRGCRMFAQEG